MDKIIKFIYQFSLFLLLCYGAHAWFTWDYDFLDYRGLIPTFAVFSAIAFIYQCRFGVKFKNHFLLLLIYLALTIAQSFPVFGFSIPISSFLRLYPIFVLLSDTKHVFDHLIFLTNVLCIIIIPGIIIWTILLFISFPGFPIQWGDLSTNSSYYFMNYGFHLKNLFYIDSIRFQSIFLEPSYFGTLVSFFLYVNQYNFKKKTTWILIVGLLLSFSLAGWLITLLGYILWRFNNGLSIRFSLMFLVLLGSFYAFASFYNDGDNAINKLIFQRLELDSRKVIKGNNRFSEDTEIIYDFYSKNNDLFWGHRKEEISSSAGFKVFFIERGIFSALFFLLFYLLIVYYTRTNQYGLYFVVLLLFTFIQAAYPDSYSWVIPFVIGVASYTKNKQLT